MATKAAEKKLKGPAVKRNTRNKRQSRHTETLPMENNQCNHHWVIAPPNGPTSSGHCKLCGQARKFPNSSEDSIWNGAEGRSRWNDMGVSRRKRSPEASNGEENAVTV